MNKGLIVYTDGRVKDQRMEFRASPSEKHFSFRLAVLVNQGTAGETEVVAGALQDHDRALVFGSKTFGKGSMQTIIPLERGLGMSLTTALYFTPKGREIQKTGIVPDINLTVEMQAEDEKNTISRTTTKPDPANDISLQKAVDWLKSDRSVQDMKQAK